MTRHRGRRYRPTESQYKGGADELYVTYDLEQRTRGGGTALYPKVKRVYVAGDVKDWRVGDFTKRTGREAHGVRVEYEQSRRSYAREGYTARRGDTAYRVQPANVKPAQQTFAKIIEVPRTARNVSFHRGSLPARYAGALQDVR